MRLIQWVAQLGCNPSDTDAVRAQKETLALATASVTVLASIWLGTYLALGLPIPAAIPFTYQLISVGSLFAFARTKNYRLMRASQLAVMLALPFLLQWSLGGFVASSAVSLWALIAALGALFFYRPAQAIPWFLAFLLLTAASGVLEPTLAQHAADIPQPLHIAFFVLNVSGVSMVAYLMLQYFVRAREAALQRSEGLLLNVLPGPIAERLKRNSGVIAESHEAVSVVFADVVDFTPFAQATAPERVVTVLDEVFTAFDRLAARHGMEKIKTIGDAYMVVAGVPEPRADHAEAAVAMALDMLAEAGRLGASLDLPDLALRVGIDSGPVIAGVIGRQKFIYDLWGDTVNTASRMESHGVPGRIQVTAAVYERLRERYAFEPRGEIEVKGKGLMATWLLVGRR